jgi:predicted ATPase/transcriptional regulator with XRE-family HTH domain
VRPPAVEHAIQPSFATLLKRYRGSRRLTQESLAEQAGLSREAISALERGERQYPRADTVDLLVRALGLSDVEHAEMIKAARPPLRPRADDVSQRPRAPDLPLAPTRLLGRTSELAVACAMLNSGGVRLLTLTGPGGVGKTRLALEVGATCRDRFTDSAAFVPLASLAAPTLLADTLARVVGALEQGERDPEDLLIEHLRDRNMLLILDNFEHLLAAAPVLANVLSACPRLAMLVTSRGIVHVRGERALPLAPLSVPTVTASLPLEELAAASAVALFIERAQAVRPEFQLTVDNADDVAAICRRLDGLPLAIELAAARMRVLSPRALLERLEQRLPTLTEGPRDLPERHRTLRAALAWSYDLLDPLEQGLFRRMSVFAGGASLDAVQAVCGVSDALHGVGVLLDHSLLQLDERTGVPESRISMLETMREYGQALLTEAGEEGDTRRAHALHYLAFAETAETELLGPHNAAWMARLEAEVDNLRAALQWMREHAAPELQVRLAGALWYFWFMSWRLTEGRTWLSPLLERTTPNPADDERLGARARTRAFAVAGFLAFNQGDYAEATTLAEAGLDLHLRTPDIRTVDKDDRAAQSYALALLGLVVGSSGEMERARNVLQEALNLGRASADTGAAVMALRHLGIVARWQKRYGESEAFLRECADASRSMPRYREYLVAWGLSNLGRTMYLQEQFGEARALLEETLTFIERSPFAGHTLADTLDWLAAVACAQGGVVHAAKLLGAAANQWRAIGAVRFPLDRAGYERDLARVREQLDEHTFHGAWAEGEAMNADQAITLALARSRVS